MRTISSDGLAKLATRLGTEPIFIVAVDWAGTLLWYADRDVESIPGKILTVGTLDNVVSVSDATSSQSIDVTLDDKDGSIKALMDVNDVHQRDAYIYQYFAGLDLDDKFLLFRGKVTTPITWNEGDRSVTFTILSQLEDQEFGFSAEEGQFPLLPADMVGKAWPVIFGTCLDVPSLRVTDAVKGTTLTGIGILSGAAYHQQMPVSGDNNQAEVQYAAMDAQISYCRVVAAAWALAASRAGVNGAPLAVEAQQWQAQANSLQQQQGQLGTTTDEQEFCANQQRQQAIINAAERQGPNPVQILGGEDFPQHKSIRLNINGGLFTGIMNGDQFTITDRYHPINESTAQQAYNQAVSALCQQPAPPQQFGFSTRVPYGFGDFGGEVIERTGWVIPPDPVASRPNTNQVAQFFWADAGSSVFIDSDEPQTYIVSIVPGTVLAVKAYKTFNNQKSLVNVPNDLWSVQTVNYGTVTAVEIVVDKPLSTITDQGWEDDIYVTFQSSVGPLVTDILAWIITNYTTLDYDATSFGVAATALSPFPANFPVLDRKNVLQLLQDIAYQARCALWLDNGSFFIKYLPAEPDSDDTITISDIKHQTMKIDLTSTDDIITKMKVTWHLSWATGNGEQPLLMILRHNVNKYGTKVREEDDDWYIFNQPDIILKAATFWLIRKSNTWKQISFSCFLNKLNLEPFDCVTLPGGYVSTDPVKAIVQKATYNADEQSVDLVCMVPVRSGEMVPYKFFWPAALGVDDIFPPAGDDAGGSGDGVNASGQLPIGYIDGIGGGGTVFVGGPNVVFRAASDRGDRTPGDVGFSAQTILPTTVYADVNNTANPNPNLELNYVDKGTPQGVPGDPTSLVVLKASEVFVSDGTNIAPVKMKYNNTRKQFFPSGTFLLPATG